MTTHAALIEAAPDLLAALKAIMRDNRADEDGSTVALLLLLLTKETWDNARAAIAKAEGTS